MLFGAYTLIGGTAGWDRIVGDQPHSDQVTFEAIWWSKPPSQCFYAVNDKRVGCDFVMAKQYSDGSGDWHSASIPYQKGVLYSLFIRTEDRYHQIEGIILLNGITKKRADNITNNLGDTVSISWQG